MITTIKTYPKICDYCHGKGQVWDNPNCINPYVTCPVCKGAGVVTVTETTFEGDSNPTNPLLPPFTHVKGK